jgi:WD40 repeat protein
MDNNNSSFLTFSMQHPSPPLILLKLIDDCERFVLRFFDVINESAMHIYHSALPWSPMSSLTRQLYQMQMTTEVKLVNAIDANWDACLREIPYLGTLNAIAFSHKGSALAVVSEEHVKIFEAGTGVATFEIDESVISVAFSPDDDMLVCGFEDGTVRVWDVQTSGIVHSFEGHVEEVFSTVFSPCGSMIVSGSGDKMVRIWDMSLGCCKCVLTGHSDWVRAVCWSGTGDRVISGSEDASVRVWDVSMQTCLLILRGHTDSGVTSVACSFDSSLVASGCKDGTVKVYDARSGDVLHSISTNDPIYSVQFPIHSDKILYTNENTATTWDLSREMQISMINYDGIYATFSSDGTRVASENDGFVTIWNTEYGDSNSETVNHHSAKLISFSPDGRVMASGSDYNVKIWDTISGDSLFSFDSHYPQSLAFSPDSTFVACWSGDFCAEVWNVHTRVQVTFVHLDTKAVYTSIALSSCGSRLVHLATSHIVLWNLKSGKSLARFDLNSPFLRESRIAFTADGTSVFVHSGDDIQQRWSISPAPISNQFLSNADRSTRRPMVFISIGGQENLPQSLSRQCCRYKGGEWILDKDGGKRILWLPPDRRGWESASESHDRKIAIGTYTSEGVYLADFSDVLLLS